MKIADSQRFRISARVLRACARVLALVVSALVLVACSSKSEPAPENVGSQSVALSTLTNQIGRLTTSGNSQRRTTFSYDALGRAKASGHAMEGVEYVYTSQYGYPKRALGPGDGEPGTVLQSARLPDGEIVSYEYDSGGRQQRMRAGSDLIVAGIRRNAKGQTVSVVHGNGVETEHRYNDGSDLRLRQIVSTHRPSGRVLQAYEYDFDNVGNVKQIRDYCNPDTDQCPCDPSLGASCLPDRLSRAFAYDEMDRLTQVRAPDGMSIAGLPRGYAYDAIDNLTQKDGVNQTYDPNGKPHALVSANGVNYNYDANGNLVSTSAGLTVTWNGQNMPTLTIMNGRRVRKQFLGEAVWKKEEGDTMTLYLPSIRIENGRLRKYYGGSAERDPDAGGALRFYHGDHLGSSTLATDVSGNVVHRAAYLPYGEDDPTFTRQNSFDPKYQFNFKEREKTTGLYDYGARMYNPATGRWISPDTSNADGLNRYAYVRNNPLAYSDPTGHFTFPLFWLPETRARRVSAYLTNPQSEAEKELVKVLPDAVAFVNEVLRKQGSSLRLDKSMVAVNYLLEGGALVTSNQVTGYGLGGLDTLISNYPALKPFLHGDVRKTIEDAMKTGKNVDSARNERGDPFKTLASMSVREAVLAHAGMLAYSMVQAGNQMKALGGNMSSLGRSNQFFWGRMYFNAGSGTAGKIMQKEGIGYADRVWPHADNYGKYGRVPLFNARMGKLTYESVVPHENRNEFDDD